MLGDEPDFTDYANVWDPNSDFYKPPETVFLVKPSSIINEHTTTFEWKSTSTGSIVHTIQTGKKKRARVIINLEPTKLWVPLYGFIQENMMMQ